VGKLELDPELGSLRAAIFPFFDFSEIVSVLGIVVAEMIFIWSIPFANAWIVPIGSYLGMAVVGWSTLPSNLEVNDAELDELVAASRALNMRQITPERFIPNLPSFLRWPRNAIEIRRRETLSVAGPRYLLAAVKDEMVSQRDRKLR
jgi:hypothetical protein